ncbi:hypothetical protein UlMin_015675 [Ulmus minor]
MPSTASSCVDLPPIGSPSFQVPPPRSCNYGLNQLVEKLTNPLTEEESMSTTAVRGWPSSNYFIQGLPFSPYTSETEFTHCTQDEDHGCRGACLAIGVIGKEFTKRIEKQNQ